MKKTQSQQCNNNNVNQFSNFAETQGAPGGDPYDMTNYKGIYFGEENKKFQDDQTGAHFEYIDMCRRLKIVQKLRKEFDEQYAKE